MFAQCKSMYTFFAVKQRIFRKQNLHIHIEPHVHRNLHTYTLYILGLHETPKSQKHRLKIDARRRRAIHLMVFGECAENV